MKKNVLLLLPTCFLAIFLIAGCEQNKSENNRIWNQNVEEAIQNGLKSEGLTSSDLIGQEIDQGDTLVFYHQDLKVGVASLSKGDKGYSWYRTTPYTALDKNDQPVNWVIYTVSSENNHSRKVVTGVVNSSRIKRVDLYVKGTLSESKVITQPQSLFYFLVRDSTVDAPSIDVRF